MKLENLISLRLGFTGKYAEVLSKKGVNYYIPYLLDQPKEFSRPGFIPTIAMEMEERKLAKSLPEEEKELRKEEEKKKFYKLQALWLEKMYGAENPLQERMTLFWHNHFVSSFQKVKSTSFIFAQNNTFRENCFGSVKELTKKLLYDNALLIYLDNNQNKIEKPNENLSRELLELFTIGIGKYTEEDIKEGARALVGLTYTENGGQYRPKKEDNGNKTYLNVSGNLKANDLVDILFAQPKITLRVTEKLLKYFLTDTPDSVLIEQYAEHLEKNNFKIDSIIKKLFLEEDFNKYSGAKIKDPLTFALQTFHELNFKTVPYKETIGFLKNQGMEIFNPPNVKGWDGGKAWLDSGKYIARNTAIINLFNQKFKKNNNTMSMQDISMQDDSDKNQEGDFKPLIVWDSKAKSNVEVIKDISDRILFNVDENMKNNLEEILKYDFVPGANENVEAVNQLVKYIMKSPEYQLL
jgi:uncharacterized protein (DUF1800 family)